MTFSFKSPLTALLIFAFFILGCNNVSRDAVKSPDKKFTDLQELAKFYLYLNNDSRQRVFLGNSPQSDSIELSKCEYRLSTRQIPAYLYGKFFYRGFMPFVETDSVLTFHFDLFFEDKYVNPGAHDEQFHTSISIDTFTYRAVGLGEHRICLGIPQRSGLWMIIAKYRQNPSHYHNWLGSYLNRHSNWFSIDQYPQKLSNIELRELYDLAKMQAYLRHFDARVNLRNLKDTSSTTHYIGELDLGAVDDDLDYWISGDTIRFQFGYSLKGIPVPVGVPPIIIQLNRRSRKVLGGNQGDTQRGRDFKDFIFNVGNPWLHQKSETYHRLNK
jgi:hypothetical protein